MRPMSGSPKKGCVLWVALAACLGASGPAYAATSKPPRPIPLNSGWEIRDVGAAAPQPQPAPPDESEEGQENAPLDSAEGDPSRDEVAWSPVRVPSVFDPDANPDLFGGTVKEYRLRFEAPAATGYRWAFRFEQVRRRATVYLNGRRLGVNADPYTPFEKQARGLRPGEVNELVVVVDSRKNPDLVEGWWNWGGITRPVTLVPRGRAHIADLGLLSDVTCKGQAKRCEAKLLVDGILSRLPKERRRRGPAPKRRKGDEGRRLGPLLPLSQPELEIRLRSPSGRVTKDTFALEGRRGARKRIALEMAVPRPELWEPYTPNLYRARVRLIYKDRVEEVTRLRIGLRSVEVKGGLIYLNNRRIEIRGASIHEDFPSHGAALTRADMDTTVAELQELGANVTRAHYVLSEAMLRRLDRAGILVWNQAPVWQRDRRPNLLKTKRGRDYAVGQVERTIKAARNHPSVLTHSVANELSFTPDRKPYTRGFIRRAEKVARDLDPTLPVAIDLKGRPFYGQQRTYARFDIIGINQYFGWYEWVQDFAGLEPFLQERRRHYPRSALVMTEFGAEGRPDMADAPADQKGSYGFQTQHVRATMDVVDRQPYLSGAIHWTLREFEIFPGWRGGAVQGSGRNTRHHKGVLTYGGARKPAWTVLRDSFARRPLYP